MRSPWCKLSYKFIPISFTILVSFCTQALGASTEFIEKAIKPNWLKETAITTGFVSSIVSYQALNGITEGYHFSQETKHIATEDNYHVYKTARDIAGISAGWFSYAQILDSRKPFLDRAGKILGGALLGRNAFEWSYKAQRYGNPFDYTEDHNRHAIVYFTIKNGALVDMYIGTGPVTGPMVDIAFTALGIFLIK